jgi:hypothetical protein
MTAQNKLVGLVTMRSNISFRDIKKSQAVKLGLNEQPRIFLTPNYLLVVTPVLVGFFVNHYPRPDMPKTFQERVKDYIRYYDPDIQYQLDYGPIWAKNRKMSVFKLMTLLDNKENLREIMGYHENSEDNNEYVCAAEFYSLSNNEKVKVIMHQVDFCAKTKSIFIHGIKNICVPLRIDAAEDDIEKQWQLGSWLNRRLTSSGQKMFSRVYQAKNGTVELYMPTANHKEAIDWAQLSTSQIAKELDEKSMQEIFVNPKYAYEKMEMQPEWKPHTLSKRIEHLVTLEPTKYQSRRRQVAMSYDSENTNEAAKKISTRNQTGNDKAKSGIEEPKTPGSNPSTGALACRQWNPLEQTTTMTNTTQPEETAGENKNVPKFGANKYKVAAAAQDK